MRIEIKTCRTLAQGADDEKFLRLAEDYGRRPYGAVLLSGTKLDCSRYSIAARNPFCLMEAKGNKVTFTTADTRISWIGNPITAIDHLFALMEPNFPLILPPFSGGAIGYLTYELKNHIETLPQKALDDLGLPDVVLMFPSEIIIHDRKRGTIKELRLKSSSFKHPIVSEPVALCPPSNSGLFRFGALNSNFSRDCFVAAVAKIRHYIREGDVYQVNLSQRFSFEFEGDPFLLFKKLFALNPAPFYAFVNAGDHFIVSTSMERFLVRQGNYIETRPIKGTRPRGDTPIEDRKLRDDLLESEKDGAELAMIVDLLRNDLGKVCKARTIRVIEHKRLESYSNVFHLISIIGGRLRDEVTHGDILRATFPGGSITGCPKIRAMEIIDELEPHIRHVYTGSIGYLGWHNNLDLSIAIRTAIISKGICHFAVGAGIVYDSKEEEEYMETLHKAKTIFRFIQSGKDKYDRRD